MSKRTTVLITGGAGYVGSVTSLFLWRFGYQPVVVDNKEPHLWPAQIKRFPALRLDLRDFKRINTALTKYRPTAVIHLAAKTSVVESAKKPKEYFMNNVSAGLNLLKAMKRANSKYLLFSSSASVFGDSQSKLTERSIRRPASVYGKTKKAFEDILTAQAKNFGVSTIILRYFNISGAYDFHGFLGEQVSAKTKLVPSMIRSYITKKPLALYGESFLTPDRTAVRDYVHVSDVAWANVLALGKLLKTKSSSVFHVASGEPRSNREVINCFEELIQEKIKIVVKGRRPGEVTCVMTSINKISKELGWLPKQSNLVNILATSLGYYQRDKNYL